MPGYSCNLGFGATCSFTSFQRTTTHSLRAWRATNPIFTRPQNGILRYSGEGEASKATSSALEETKSSLARLAWELPLLPGQRKPRDGNIVPESLQATIEAHREANLKKQIHKYFSHEPDTAFDIHKWRHLEGLREPAEASFGPDHRNYAPAEKVGSARIRKVSSDSFRPQTSKDYRSKASFHPYRGMLQLDYSCNSQERLDNEIKAFRFYLEPTKSEASAVTHCMQLIRDKVSEVFPASSLVLHGSRDTGLAGPLSDIDFNIQLPEFEENKERGPTSQRPDIKKIGAQTLDQLKRVLEKDNRYAQIQSHETHRLSVLQAHDLPTGLHIQFISQPLNRGTEFCKYYLAEYPQLRPLHTLLSYSLRNAGLHDVSTGGIGSYALFMIMLTAFTHTENHFKQDELGRQLIHVLNFWTRANPLRDGYAPDPARLFPKWSRLIANGSEDDPSNKDDPSMAGIRLLISNNLRELERGTRSRRLCLQDPANPINDLGRSTWRIEQIQKHFRKILAAVQNNMQNWDRMTSQERLMHQHGSVLLRGLIDTDWQVFAGRRYRVGKASPTWI